MTAVQEIVTIIVVVAGTMLTRFLPFIIFPEGKKPPAYISYLGTVLPYAVIGLLVVYCLTRINRKSFFAFPPNFKYNKENYWRMCSCYLRINMLTK